MNKIIKKNDSRLGLFLIFSYLLLSALSVGCGIFAEGDPKGRFVYFQIPVMFQSAALIELGLIKYFDGMSWTEAYIYLGSPTIFFLYYLGYAIESVSLFLWKLRKNNTKS